MSTSVAIRWQTGLRFVAKVRAHDVVMDAAPPLGGDAGMTPKELVLAGLCGCTAMDVAAYLRKFKQPLESLDVSVAAEKSTGKAPAVFTEARLVFRAKGALDSDKLLEAVRLSQTQYCGVSAMLALAFPISYEVWLGDQQIGSGEAKFSTPPPA